jgi:hypothetical protein
MAIKMQQRRGTAAEWTSANPTLAAGEIGFETDTNKFKIGDGSTIWASLKYYATATDLEADIAGTSPIIWTANPPGVSGTQATISFNQSAQNDTNDSRYVRLTGGATNVIVSPDINSVPLTINAIASQAVNLQNWKVDTATKASIDKDGNITTVSNLNAPTGDTSGTAGIVNASRIRLGDTTDVSTTSTKHALQIGPSSGQFDRLLIDANEIHVYNEQPLGTVVGSTLTLNGDGGTVAIGKSDGSSTTNIYGTVNLGNASAGTIDFLGTIANGNTIAAGTTTAGTAPLKLTQATSGTTLAIPEAGAIESTIDGVFVTSNPGSTTTGVGRGLVTAPQMVYSLANSSAATTNTAQPVFAAANDVLSVLEPAKLYRFSGKYYVTSTFTSGTANIQTLFGFSNAPTAIKYSYKTYNQTAATTTVAAVGTGSAVTGIQVSPSVTATVNYVIEFDGYFTTHATSTSTLTPQFQMSTTGSSTVVTAGSYFQVEKLGTSTTTLVSGNWA